MILALDIGHNLGWAALHDDRSVSSATHKLQRGFGRRGESLWLWLDTMEALGPITRVFVERPAGFYKTFSTAQSMHGLFEVVGTWCRARRKPQPTVIVPTQLKKHATGSGRAEKGDVIRFMRQRWPGQLLTDNDNQADALAVLAWAIDNKGV